MPSVPGPFDPRVLPIPTEGRWEETYEHVRGWVLVHWPAMAASVLGALVLSQIAVRCIARWRHRHAAEGAQLVQIHPPPHVRPEAAAVFWSNLVGLLRSRWRRLLLGQPHVALEYLWHGPRLHIQLWVSGPIPARLVARAVEAAWPAARTALTDPAPLLPVDRPGTVPSHPGQPATGTPATGIAGTVSLAKSGDLVQVGGRVVAMGGQLRLARPDHYPLGTGTAAGREPDPLRPLLGAATGMKQDQYAAVQVLVRPVTGRRLRGAYRAAAALRGADRPTPIGRVLDLLTPGPGPAGSSGPRPGQVAAAFPERAGQVRAIVDKATGPRLEVIVRYGTATTLVTDPAAARAWARGRAHAIASAFAVFAGHNHFDRHRLRRPAEQLAARRMGRGDLLSVGELAAIAHLPFDPAVPGLARSGANAVPPPPQVPAGGPGTKPLGDCDTSGDLRRPVALPVADARHHLHVIGATGSGKSTLIAQLVLSDAAAGRAVVVIDPRGDLIDDLLDRLPEQAARRVWLIDPDSGPPPALGVLSGPDAHLTGDNLVAIVHRIFADSWGPRTDDILRSAILTLHTTPQATLADVPRLLTDPAYRSRAVAHLHPVHDDVLAGFWTWYTGLSPEARATAIGPVMNKLRHFLLRPFVRQLLGTPGPGLDVGRLLDGGGLLLVRVPKGVLGEDTARLIGSIVLAKIWETTTARARHRQAARRDAALYIDEAHAFLNLPHGLEDMLAEARGYRLSVVLAHQNLAQMPPALRESIAANARNKLLFSLSPQDAHDLARHTLPTLTDHDLANLAAYQAAARLLIGAAETPAFTLTTRPLPEPIPGRAHALREAAHHNAASTRTTTPPIPVPDPRTGHPGRFDHVDEPGADQPPPAHPPA